MSNTTDNTEAQNTGPTTAAGQGPHTEQQFTILPYPNPAKPDDSSNQKPDAGLGGGTDIRPFLSPGPQIISEEMAKSLEKPASREELEERTKALNQNNN